MNTYKSEHNARVLNISNKFDIENELVSLNSDKRAFDILEDNMYFMHIKLEEVDTRAANIIKQQIKRIGGEAAISKEAYAYTARHTDMVISGSRKSLQILTKKISTEQYQLQTIAKEIESCLEHKSGIVKIKNKVYDFNHETYVVGALDFHKHILKSSLSQDAILERIDELVKAGADIIELCGEDLGKANQTRLFEKEEIERIIPLIHMIKRQFPEVPISLDTCNYNVAKAGLEAGVDLVNEVIPLKYNPELVSLIAKYDIPVILMYNPIIGKNPKPLTSISAVIREIQSNIVFAIRNGVKKNNIIIDPGIGFGRSDKDNFLILKQLSSFKHLNYPIMVGMSRKSFLGEALEGKMDKEHISTIAATTIAIINGANIIRLHTGEQIKVTKNIISSLHNGIE